ncbi:MAG: low molecular weight protein-tyrosine-phosphatase [Nitriliruptorales bacterium]
MPVVRVLLVCLGNICRSPTAEAAVREAAAAAGVEVEVDSAGTGDWNLGRSPDPRMVAAARAVGLELEGRARQVVEEDFDRYDLILAMDGANLRRLQALAPSQAAERKVRLFRSFEAGAPEGAEVPDPYHGGRRGFEHVVELSRASARGLVDAIAAGRV